EVAGEQGHRERREQAGARPAPAAQREQRHDGGGGGDRGPGLLAQERQAAGEGAGGDGQRDMIGEPGRGGDGGEVDHAGQRRGGDQDHQPEGQRQIGRLLPAGSPFVEQALPAEGGGERQRRDGEEDEPFRVTHRRERWQQAPQRLVERVVAAERQEASGRQAEYPGGAARDRPQ